MSLTDKYRQKEFRGLLGNEENIEFLQTVIQKKDHSHSYLFCGEFGCGKTTMARILANKFDCNEIIELNSSNNRGIDTIRDLIENAQYKTLTGSNKCYILDEPHQMTKDAQNALLKILEEPPKHVYFMLCTTDPQKLLSTIKSRCVKIEVEKIDVRTLLSYLFDIAKKEGKEVSKKVCRKVAQSSGGHVRDALKLLEKVLSIEGEEKQLRVAESNIVESSEIIELCQQLLKGDWNTIRKILKGIDEEPEKVRRAVLRYMSAVLLNGNNNRAAIVIESFCENFYDSGKAGLILACYQVFL